MNCVLWEDTSVVASSPVIKYRSKRDWRRRGEFRKCYGGGGDDVEGVSLGNKVYITAVTIDLSVF